MSEPARQPDQRLDSMDPIASDLLVRLQRCEAAIAARERQLASLREAELIDLKHGYALPGDSALAVAFRGLDELDADQQDSE